MTPDTSRSEIAYPSPFPAAPPSLNPTPSAQTSTVSAPPGASTAPRPDSVRRGSADNSKEPVPEAPSPAPAPPVPTLPRSLAPTPEAAAPHVPDTEPADTEPPGPEIPGGTSTPRRRPEPTTIACGAGSEKDEFDCLQARYTSRASATAADRSGRGMAGSSAGVRGPGATPGEPSTPDKPSVPELPPAPCVNARFAPRGGSSAEDAWTASGEIEPGSGDRLPAVGRSGRRALPFRFRTPRLAI